MGVVTSNMTSFHVGSPEEQQDFKLKATGLGGGGGGGRANFDQSPPSIPAVDKHVSHDRRRVNVVVLLTSQEKCRAFTSHLYLSGSAWPAARSQWELVKREPRCG